MARRGSRSISWDTGSVTSLLANIERLGPRVEQAAFDIMDRQGDLATAYMKTNAPWTDRTSVARNGLGAKAFKQGKRLVLNLFGKARYQIWLEVKNNGRYAIITPTFEIWGPRVMRSMQGLIDRLRARV
jgi:hypothetical protein